MSDVVCIRCGAPVDERDERMNVGIEIVKDDGHELLDEVVLCKKCAAEYEDHLSLTTRSYKGKGS